MFFDLELSLGVLDVFVLVGVGVDGVVVEEAEGEDEVGEGDEEAGCVFFEFEGGVFEVVFFELEGYFFELVFLFCDVLLLLFYFFCVAGCEVVVFCEFLGVGCEFFCVGGVLGGEDCFFGVEGGEFGVFVCYFFFDFGVEFGVDVFDFFELLAEVGDLREFGEVCVVGGEGGDEVFHSGDVLVGFFVGLLEEFVGGEVVLGEFE